MTRCTKSMVNLKSSAYNQTGQNYFEQLAAYNSMSSHLRRILLAKSTVDARNKNYSLKKSQRCKIQDADIKKTYLHREVTDDVIEKLAYSDTRHPMDVLRMNFNLKEPDCCTNLNCHQSRICGNHMGFEKNDQIDHRQRSKSKNEKIIPIASHFMNRKKIEPSFVCGKGLKSVRKVPHTIDLPAYCQWRKCKHEKDPLFGSCTTTTLDLSMFESKSQSMMQEMNNHRLTSSHVAPSYDDLNDKSTDQYIISKHCSSKKEEEKKYIKFVYDITKEIMQKGLYTDEELQDVFKKHIERHRGILNMNKMLYEIYQLKISLNIVESDTDDELEDLIHAQKLLSVSEIRPPTPPKILDEDKVMEKLKSYRKMMEAENRPLSATGKSVTLVDANPELFITERDVLISLMEVGIDPKQAQHICKNLLQKSKDTDDLVRTVSSTAENYLLDLEVDNLEKLQSNDVSTFPEAETNKNNHDSIVDYSAKSSIKQKTSSSMSNVTMQDETMEIKMTTESQSTVKDDDKIKNDKIES